MPFVTVDHFAGVSAPVRRQLQQRLTQALAETFSAPPATVRVFTRAFDPADVYVGGDSSEPGLPVIRIEHLPGRSEEQKRAVANAMSQAAAEVLQIEAKDVRTVFYERTRLEWARGGAMMADS